MAIAEIHVTLKPTLLDAQGTTVTKALHQLGYDAVRNVRIGKYITVEVDDSLSGAALQQQLDKMCQSLLSNPVIEDYEITLAGSPSITEGTVSVAPLTTVMPPSPLEVSEAPGVPRSALSVSEQLETGQVSSSTVATPDPFAMDYAAYNALPAQEQLAVQELAWRKHGTWILKQMNDRRAQWILCLGGEVLQSGDTIDSYPTEAYLTQLGADRQLVPWIFTRPPQ